MYVCGQKNLLQDIDTLVKNNKFPRFSIIVGDTGFGKKVISEYIAKQLEASFVPCSVDVESVRDTIANAYEMTEKTLYMFFDCDGMSTQAKNALLKVTEEPPNNAYFIMTVRDISNILGTLISRGTMFHIAPYSINDLDDFIATKNYDFDAKTLKIIHQVCVCPRDVQIAKNSDIKSIYDLADKYIQFIGQVNIANELKINTQLSTKKDDEKIDPTLFLRCVMLCCNAFIIEQCSKEDLDVFNTIIKETSSCLQDITSKGCNRQMALDNWIIGTHMKLNGGAL